MVGDDDWDVEERALATLDRLGLDGIGLDRGVGELSGGEGVLLGLAAELLRRARRAAARRADQQPRPVRAATAVRRGRGVPRCAAGGQPRPRAARPGRPDRRPARRRPSPGTAATSPRTRRRSRSSRRRRSGRSAPPSRDLRRQQRELAEARIKLDRRRRYGQKMWDTKREPKIIMGAKKRAAQVAAGKHRNLHLDARRPPGTRWPMPRRWSATTTRSGSTCRTPRCPPAGWCCG